MKRGTECACTCLHKSVAPASKDVMIVFNLSEGGCNHDVNCLPADPGLQSDAYVRRRRSSTTTTTTTP